MHLSNSLFVKILLILHLSKENEFTKLSCEWPKAIKGCTVEIRVLYHLSGVPFFLLDKVEC